MEDEPEFIVVINAEEQYSVWLSETSPPHGWTDVGVRGSKRHCVEWIDEHWTNMLPRSVRERLAEDAVER
jgi:MbtH protein